MIRSRFDLWERKDLEGERGAFMTHSRTHFLICFIEVLLNLEKISFEKDSLNYTEYPLCLETAYRGPTVNQLDWKTMYGITLCLGTVERKRNLTDLKTSMALF